MKLNRTGLMLVLAMAIFALAVVVMWQELAAEESPRPASGIQQGLVVMLGNEIDRAVELAGQGRCVVHLMADAAHVEALRQKVQMADLGGRIVVAPLPAGGRLPHPDRFVNLLVADLDALGGAAPTAAEIQRVLAVGGASRLMRNGQWETRQAAADPRLDGWFAHWYDAGGNCVSQDRVAGFPRSVQWQHGPALEDGTADGKIVRVADGCVVFLDNLSGNLICRDAANGLLRWRQAVGSGQASDLCIAGGRVHLWFDAEQTQRPTRGAREVGYLTAFDLATGKVAKVYDQGLRAGTAPAIDFQSDGRLQRSPPTPWVVVSETLVVQAYGRDLVVLDRQTGQRRWVKQLEKGAWFSPIVAGDLVLAAESEDPARRARNDGADLVRAVAAFAAQDGKPVWRNDQVHPLVELRDKDRTFQHRGSFKTMSAAGNRLLLHVSSYQFREGGSLALLDLASGRELWRRQFQPKDLYTAGSQRPVLRGDEVILLDGTGVYRYSAKTGEPVGSPITRPKEVRRTGRTNGACTASRATVDWLMANSWLYVGPDGKPQVAQGARGACGQGMVPAQGLLFVAPTPCDCGDYTRGYLGLAPSLAGRKLEDAARLTQGVVVKLTQETTKGWPIFLGNPCRTSATAEKLPENLTRKWTAKLTPTRDDDLERDRKNSERYLGPLSAPVAAEGLVVAAASESHAVVACDSATGQVRWRYPTGGKVDSPPTLARGLAVFGCDDGAVYAVEAASGKLAWRFVIAPTDGLAMHHGHLASAFPVPGSVLVLGDRVLAMAGYHTDLGGLHVWSLDLATGVPQARRVLATDAPPALANNLLVADADGKGFWVVSPQGGSYGAGGAYHLAADLTDLPMTADTPGPALSFDRQGCRVRFRTDQGRGGSTHGWKQAMRGTGFTRLNAHRVVVAGDQGFGLNDPTSPRDLAVWAVQGKGKESQERWRRTAEELGVASLGAMLLAGDQLVIGGGSRDGKSGLLLVLAADSGAVKQKINLPSRVTECGLAVTGSRLYVTCEDGSMHCLGR